jgi:hypothetical protein
MCPAYITYLGDCAKYGGYIIILDQYNKSSFFSFILFYLTLFLSIFGLSFEYFGLGKNVIVSFLTPDETRNFLIKGRNVELILDINHSISYSRRFRYTLIMSSIGRIVLIGKKNKI